LAYLIRKNRHRDPKALQLVEQPHWAHCIRLLSLAPPTEQLAAIRYYYHLLGVLGSLLGARAKNAAALPHPALKQRWSSQKETQAKR
jgi:hypothetical protein